MKPASSTRWQRFANVAVPVSAGFLLTMSALEETNKDTSDWAVLLAFICGIGMATALRWRHTRPIVVACIVAVGSNVLGALAPYGLIPWAGAYSVYAVAARRSVLVSLPLLIVTAASVGHSRGHYPIGDLFFIIACLAAIWALGEASRNRRNAYALQTQRVVSDEKARIARELHDVLAHSVSVIVVQASAASDIFDTNPGRAREALVAIETTGRQTLTELRSLLASVDDHRASTVDAPQPTLDDLPRLTETLRTAGLDVSIEVQGAKPDMPASVELAAFRIVQEALTNSLRHSGAPRADVCITYEPAALTIEITDSGTVRRSASLGSGRGIVGMRERATMLGGSLDAGTRDEGGFRVHAVLPLKGKA